MKIGILGAAGRMGQMLIRETVQQGGFCALGGALEHKEHPALGKDAAQLAGLEPYGIKITDDARALFQACDVVIDFTTPTATTEHAALSYETGTALVIGTTGLDDAALAAVKTAAQKAPVVYASNFSLGITLLSALVEQTAGLLGDDFDIEIYEAHHRHKKDAPSGTALTLGESAAKGRKVSLKDAMVPARYGETGERVKGSIGFSVFRGGDVVGDHSVTFAGDGERIELGHKASNRGIFAKGAVKSALWLKDKEAGLYNLRDVLGL